MSVEYVRPIEIARCCIVIRRLNRNNTEEEEEGRERESERVCARKGERKIEKSVVRACMFGTVTLVRRTYRLKE